MVVIDLTKDGFIANVGDFEANPKDWKYIGDRKSSLPHRFSRSLVRLLQTLKLYIG